MKTLPGVHLPKRKRGRPSKADVAKREQIVLQAARKTDETHEERVARISKNFDILWKLAQGSIAGQIRSFIVSGAPGVGKSHTLDHLLSTAAEQDKIRYEVVHGTLTAINLYKLLYKFRQSNHIVLLDDADGIFEDEDAMNLMKAALDTSSVRRLSWLSESAALKAENIDTQFIYEGAMIFITNKDFQGMVDFGTNKLSPHFGALMSRSLYLDLKLHSPEDLLAWCCHMVETNHILVQRGVDRSQEAEALEWLKENFETVRELSIRTLLKIADFMIMEPTNWKSFAEVLILR